MIENWTPSRKSQRLYSWLAGTFFIFSVLPARAIDLLPGAIRPLDDSINFAQFIYTYTEFGDKYTQGVKQPGNTELDSSLYQIRLGRYVKLADHPAMFYINFPVGDVTPKGSLGQFSGDRGWEMLLLILISGLMPTMKLEPI